MESNQERIWNVSWSIYW